MSGARGDTEGALDRSVRLGWPVVRYGTGTLRWTPAIRFAGPMTATNSPELFILLFMAGALLVTFLAVAVLMRTAAAAPRGVVVAGRFDSRVRP